MMFFKLQKKTAGQEEMAMLDHLIIELEKHIGKKLTMDEQHDVLEIVEECSAKCENGYIIEYIPLDYAWMIYLMRKEGGDREQ